jgi:hypothetical protein
MAEAAAALLGLGLAAPHALPLARVSPAASGAVWLASLALRALLVLGVALSALLLLPATVLFDRVSGWSAHETVGPLHLDLSGEPIAHTAALGPPGLLAVSLLVFAVTLTRGSLALRRELGRRSLGSGPLGSFVIADESLLVAVPGVGPGRILVSDRALGELDAAELEACLAHEKAHLRRCHRTLGLLAGCLAAIARPVPGARTAERGVRLSLERDADECAVARTGDPLALASAICKLAGAPGGTNARGPLALGLAGDGDTRARLDALLAGGRARSSAVLERFVQLLGMGLSLLVVAAAVGLTLWLAATTPPAAPAAAFACSS